MSALTLKKFTLTALNHDLMEQLGVNLLNKKRPKVTALSETPVTCQSGQSFGENNLDILTDDSRIWTHVDLRGAPLSLTYDIGHSVKVDKIGVFGLIKGYFLTDIAIYASNDADTLYTDENLIHRYSREKNPEHKKNRDFIYDTEGSCRYFGVVINAPCDEDEIARVTRIALFSDYNNIKNDFIRQLNIQDLFSGLIPKITGKYEGNAAELCNGKTLRGEEAVTALEDIVITFQKDKVYYINTVYIIGRGVKIKSAEAGAIRLVTASAVSDTYDNRKIHKIDFEPTVSDSISIAVEKGAVIDLIAGKTNIRRAKVSTEDVILKDFIGSGSNVFPTSFSEDGIKAGYNEVFWELEKHHIVKMRPHCVRMWFQIDWIVQTLTQYENGDWQFDSPAMNSVVKYCRFFNEAGIEVELNFGWKIGSAVQDWFSIKELPEKSKKNSAPSDLYNYGKACAATLEYLILDNGCDNVKYLSFYNEPALSPHNVFRDFSMSGDTVGYWASMAKYAHYFIKRSRIAEAVEIWGCEQDGWYGDIMERMNVLIPDVFSRHTIHRYFTTYDEICHWYDTEIIPNSDGKPVLLTEYGNSSRNCASWDCSHASALLAGASHGVGGAFNWVLSGQPLPDPLGWMHSRSAKGCADDGYTCWEFLPIVETLDEVGESFYELCLLTNYIPNHAQALRCGLCGDIRDLRINAFFHNGEYTVCVENRQGESRDVEIKFDKPINRKFYRHVYTLHRSGEGNLIIPPSEKEIETNDTLSDTTLTERSLIVYTTMKPVPQVIMENVDIRVPAGSHIEIRTTVLDSDEAPKLSVSKSLCKGAVLRGNTVIIPPDAEAGAMLAVKAELPTREYGISIIRVVT